jgi:hypothetical protein
MLVLGNPGNPSRSFRVMHSGTSHHTCREHHHTIMSHTSSHMLTSCARKARNTYCWAAGVLESLYPAVLRAPEGQVAVHVPLMSWLSDRHWVQGCKGRANDEK